MPHSGYHCAAQDAEPLPFGAGLQTGPRSTILAAGYTNEQLEYSTLTLPKPSPISQSNQAILP